MGDPQPDKAYRQAVKAQRQRHKKGKPNDRETRVAGYNMATNRLSRGTLWEEAWVTGITLPKLTDPVYLM